MAITDLTNGSREVISPEKKDSLCNHVSELLLALIAKTDQEIFVNPS